MSAATGIAQADRAAWPRLDWPSWRDTGATLHRWTQIVGKVRLALTPWLNHGWQVPLYVTARGLGTTAIHGTWPKGASSSGVVKEASK